MKLRDKYLFAVVSGALLALSFPPVPLPLFAFIGLVPLLIIFETEPETNHKFTLLYLAFFIYHGGTNWWISSWQEQSDPYLFASGIATWIVHPFFFMLPFIPYFYMKSKLRGYTALSFFPVFWIVFEWTHGLGDLSYPWLTLGNTQIHNTHWIQFIDITGVWGASLLIVIANTGISRFILEYRRLNRAGLKSELKNMQIKFSIALIAFLLIPYIYGFVRIAQFDHDDLLNKGESLNIGLIQPNIDPWEKWQLDPYQQVLLHMELQDSLKNEVKQLDLAIWSETAIRFLGYSFNRDHDFSFLKKWVDTSKTALLSGIVDYYFYPEDTEIPPSAKRFEDAPEIAYESYNAALLINPVELPDTTRMHRKMRLTPFAERLPYVEIFSFAKKWFEWGVGISGWAKGKVQKPLLYHHEEDSAYIGTIICIESIYPDFVKNFTLKGATILSVITNDSWFDHTPGPEQHYQIAAVRAIENRRYIARTANSGVTGFIKPTGETLLRAKQYEKTAVAATIPELKVITPYVRFGNWLPFLGLVITVIALFYARFRKH
ncbi:MAG: apolipoprotein N-acyltransferase [Candidatus Kapaibacterium sp.]